MKMIKINRVLQDLYAKKITGLDEIYLNTNMIVSIRDFEISSWLSTDSEYYEEINSINPEMNLSMITMRDIDGNSEVVVAVESKEDICSQINA